MKKASLLKIVNPIIGVLFLVQAGSGIFSGLIPYELFHIFHGPVGFLFTLFVVIHVYLNWSWIVTNFLKKKSVAARNTAAVKTGNKIEATK
jgi:hypothetical protein